MSADPGSWLATGLGLGCTPWLPGTAGALAGAVAARAIGRLRARARLPATLAMVVVALPVCTLGDRALPGDDPRIVADELLTFPVATLALPVRRHPGLLAAVFVGSRVLDGLKPPPARAAEGLGGGVGIVLDDVVANVWTLVLALAGWHAWKLRRRAAVHR